MVAVTLCATQFLYCISFFDRTVLPTEGRRSIFDVDMTLLATQFMYLYLKKQDHTFF